MLNLIVNLCAQKNLLNNSGNGELGKGSGRKNLSFGLELLFCVFVYLGSRSGHWILQTWQQEGGNRWSQDERDLAFAAEGSRFKYLNLLLHFLLACRKCPRIIIIIITEPKCTVKVCGNGKILMCGDLAQDLITEIFVRYLKTIQLFNIRKQRP